MRKSFALVVCLLAATPILMAQSKIQRQSDAKHSSAQRTEIVQRLKATPRALERIPRSSVRPSLKRLNPWFARPWMPSKDSVKGWRADPLTPRDFGRGKLLQGIGKREILF
jgi:hypothetical protein